MMNAEKVRRRCNRAAALLMAVVLGCLFIPYWSYGEGLSASVNSYVWFPTTHQGLTEELLPLVEKYPCNQAAMASIPVLLLCALGMYFCLFRADKGASGVLAAVAGGYGLISYLTSPVMMAGDIWWVHAMLFAMILAAGLVAMRRSGEPGSENAAQ